MARMMWEPFVVFAIWAATCGLLLGVEPTQEPTRDRLAEPKANAEFPTRTKATVVPILTRQRLFSIPFYLNPQVRPPQEVLLFVSGDQGQTWSLYQRRRALDQKFDFQAGGDGEYWFVVRTDQDGQPPDSNVKPEKIVVVDTVAPELTVTVDVTPSGSLQGRWHAADENLDHTTFRLQYQVPGEDQWLPVTVDLPSPEPQRTEYDGRVSWTVLQRQGSVRVRAEVLDRAGNSAEYDEQIELRAGVPAPLAGTFSPGVDGRQRERPLINSPPPLPWTIDSTASEKPNDVHGTETGAPELPPPASASNRFVSDANPPPSESSPVRPEAAQPTAPSDYVFRSDDRGIPMRESAGPPSEIKTSSNSEVAFRQGNPASPVQETELRLRPDRSLPMTASPRFNLEYEFVDINAQDVARVELWITEDAGRTWTFYGTDADRSPPFDVEVPREGIYGFRLLIQDQHGNSAIAPQAGDQPDLSIGVDWTRPEAKLNGARFIADFSGRALEINWEATDRNLGNTPIRLSYAGSPQDAWTPITADLPNLGQFRWRPDVDLPERLFLQLEVIDQAGNLTRVQMPEPIVVRETVPQGRIRRIDPIVE